MTAARSNRRGRATAGFPGRLRLAATKARLRMSESDLTAQTASIAFGAEIWPSAAAILFLLLLSAFFSGSETALTAASRARLKRLAEEGSKGAESALKLTEDSERLIGAILLGNNLVNILATSLATSLLLAMFGRGRRGAGHGADDRHGAGLRRGAPQNLCHLQSRNAPPKLGRADRLPPSWCGCSRRSSRLVRLIVRGVLQRCSALKTDPDAERCWPPRRKSPRADPTWHHSEGAVEKRRPRPAARRARPQTSAPSNQVMLHRSGTSSDDRRRPCRPRRNRRRQCLRCRPIPASRSIKNEPENIVGVIHAKDLLARRGQDWCAAPGGDPSNISADFEVMDV